jgi:hypothetical protein
VNSKQIGSLNLFDIASVIERTELKTKIDGTEDFWYKITFNNIEGFVFGGYGIILLEKYEIKTIDDVITILPSKFQSKEWARHLFWHDSDKIPMVRLHYGLHSWIIILICFYISDRY